MRLGEDQDGCLGWEWRALCELSRRLMLRFAFVTAVIGQLNVTAVRNGSVQTKVIFEMEEPPSGWTNSF
jgi:hypothetical protein